MNEDQGSVEKALAGDYSLTIADVLGEAWRAMYGYKLTLQGALLLLTLVLLGLGIVQAVLGSDGYTGSGLNLLNIVVTLLSYGFIGVAAAGLVVLGARVSRDEAIKASDVFEYLPLFFKAMATYVLMMLLVGLGFLLLILPGIYLYVAYFYALPLALEKGLSPWEALETSRKAVTHRWFTVFGLKAVLWLMSIAAFFTLGIGLIWLLPLSVVAYGIVYRNMFGLESVHTEA